MQTYQNHPKRIQSLDVFRGITIALMIVVNSPGLSVSYTCLAHSPWNGCSLADLVFPFFLVILGASCVLALSKFKDHELSKRQCLKQIAYRSVYLFAVGVLLNAFPSHFDVSTLRILGVLQRIAICYFIASLVYLTTRLKTQVLLIIALLIGYSWLIGNDVYTISENLVAKVDLWVFSPNHLYNKAYDPEGLLSTIPAITSTLFGIILGTILISLENRLQQLKWIMALGMGFAALGFAWNSTLAFNKFLWSSSYVLWTSGLAYLTFALCLLMVDIKQWTLWAKPFTLFGKNALLVYVLHVALLKIQVSIRVYDSKENLVNIKTYITQLLFGQFSPENASLCYALLYTLFWLLVLSYKNLPIYKKFGYSPPF